MILAPPVIVVATLLAIFATYEVWAWFHQRKYPSTRWTTLSRFMNRLGSKYPVAKLVYLSAAVFLVVFLYWHFWR